MIQKFTPEQFVATANTTSEDKAHSANLLIDFIEGDFPEDKFTKELYVFISGRLGGFHAHMNRENFYDAWFETTLKKHNFVKNLMESSIIGKPEYSYSDVQEAVQNYLRKNREIYINLIKTHNTEVEQAERVLLRELLKRYPDEYGKI